MQPQILTQRDTRWANIKIGNSNATIGQEGCLITDISMACLYFGSPMNPDEIASHVAWFDVNGSIYMDLFQNPNLKFLKETTVINILEIQGAIHNPKQVVFLQVSNPTTKQTHWLWAWKRKLFNDWYCADPWTGRVVAASDYLHSIGPITKAIYMYNPH